jgi:hypothetical protein
VSHKDLCETHLRTKTKAKFDAHNLLHTKSTPQDEQNRKRGAIQLAPRLIFRQSITPITFHRGVLFGFNLVATKAGEDQTNGMSVYRVITK